MFESVFLEFWGVRGTAPTLSADRLRYGGNTICLGARLAEDEYLVLDCGTGALHLGKAIEAERAKRPTRIHLLFSHYHFDHIEGLRLFAPLYDPAATIRIYGFAPPQGTLQETFESFLRPPYFPLSIAGAPASVEYAPLDGRAFTIGDIQVSTLALNHPDGCLAYRLERRGRRFVFATDHEHGDPEVDAALADFAAGADHLVYDATYLPAEYESLRRGWGHSTWYAAVSTARAAGVKTLVLFHHHPEHNDADLEAILDVAREEFPGTILAREGMTLPL